MIREKTEVTQAVICGVATALPVAAIVFVRQCRPCRRTRGSQSTSTCLEYLRPFVQAGMRSFPAIARAPTWRHSCGEFLLEPAGNGAVSLEPVDLGAVKRKQVAKHLARMFA